MSIPISEVFMSLSGEGLTAGLSTTFIRVAGCNLAEKIENGGKGSPCSYCDSSFAWYKRQGTPMTIDEIVKTVKTFPTREVLLTGGEPLIINPLKFNELVRALSTYHISVETSGSIMPWNIEVDSYVVDMKCPSSGNSQHNLYRILLWLRKRDQVKFVIGNRDDFVFAKDVMKEYPTKASVLISPIWCKLNLQEVWEWVKEIPQSRLSLQLHKIIWGNKKGV